MPLSEADTRAKLIDPALHACGWTEDLIKREEAAPAVDVDPGTGRARRRGHGRLDYLLRVKVHRDTQPVAVALIEAKAEHLPPDHGLEQAKAYAACRRLAVQLAYASNGHLFVEYDRQTGKTSAPQPLMDFPSPAQLRRRYEAAAGFSLDSESARPLLCRYPGGEATRRYYQDAAIRAALEKIARGEKRVLLSLATGAGKTFIAVHLLRKIADAGQLRRALFVCDRDELRTQAAAELHRVFGAEAAVVSARAPQKNARILVATYQTLGVEGDEEAATFLTENYPANYFSQIVIDECHRSAWGHWSQVLTRNPDAVQIGLTATPRRIEVAERTAAAHADEEITADNVRHFGEPVYEYDMSQGQEDGYLAACEIAQRDIFLDDRQQSERERLLVRRELAGKRLTDARTGELLSVFEARDAYAATAFESRLLLPDRVAAMCRDLFGELCATGGPEQKTIIFCARDAHADAVTSELGNLYADWCAREGRPRAEPYAFKCTAQAGDADRTLADFKELSRHHLIATTVDLLTTGVDVPWVRNIVFFKYTRSPISFYQMVGRGTRIHEASGKLMFRVYDYTDATRLFGQAFLTKALAAHERRGPVVDGGEQRPPEQIIRAEGFDVRVTPAGRYILIQEDGRAVPVTLEAYKERLAARLAAEVRTLDDFRCRWEDPAERERILAALPDGERSAALVRTLSEQGDYDLYDVLADLAYGLAPRTRRERADAFLYKHAAWLDSLPPVTAATLKALAAQFARNGTDELENPQVFRTPAVLKAGGLSALKVLGGAAEVLREAKRRLFAA